MTDMISVFNWMSNAGFHPNDYEYMGHGIIATPRFGYEPKIGDYVKVSKIATTAGSVLWVYSSNPTDADGTVCGSHTIRGDVFGLTWWRVQLNLNQGHIYIE